MTGSTSTIDNRHCDAALPSLRAMDSPVGLSTSGASRWREAIPYHKYRLPTGGIASQAAQEGFYSDGENPRTPNAMAMRGCRRKKLLACTLCFLAAVLPCSAETHLLGGLSPDDALEYMKATKDLVIIEVNQKQWKKKVPFTVAMRIPYDQMERCCKEIPAGRPAIFHCGLGAVSVPAYETLMKVRHGIPELPYIAGAPPIAEYNERAADKRQGMRCMEA